MGETSTNAAAWQAAGQAISTAGSALAQSNLNRKQRKWNEEMYERQRKDALADWTMQNEYSSPTAQMSRLKAAGLNPMLIYGKGPGDMVGPAIRSSSAPSWNPKAPDYSGMGQSLQSYMNVKMQQLQMDNLKAQNTVLLEEAALKRAQSIATTTGVDKTKVDTERARFDLDFERGLASISAEVRKQSLRQLETNTTVTLARNEREAIAQDQTIAESVARIARMRAQTANDTRVIKNQETKQVWEINKIGSELMNDANKRKLDQLDIDLKEKGVQPGDELWQRMIARILEELGIMSN